MTSSLENMAVQFIFESQLTAGLLLIGAAIGAASCYGVLLYRQARSGQTKVYLILAVILVAVVGIACALFAREGTTPMTQEKAEHQSHEAPSQADQVIQIVKTVEETNHLSDSDVAVVFAWCATAGRERRDTRTRVVTFDCRLPEDVFQKLAVGKPITDSEQLRALLWLHFSADDDAIDPIVENAVVKAVIGRPLLERDRILIGRLGGLGDLSLDASLPGEVHVPIPPAPAFERPDVRPSEEDESGGGLEPPGVAPESPPAPQTDSSVDPSASREEESRRIK